MVRLGEFEVLGPLARGGMGEVWRARHPGQDVPVAIKVMAEDLATLPHWRERFRTEVRSMASLEHPGVVWVFDYGEVTPEASAGSGGALPTGVPWVAMELASAGALDQRMGSLRWASIRTLLLSLLDTLAHAHARRVVHRDLKPANVLLCGPHDLRPGPKLTDFGIAASLEEDTSTGDRMMGTPAYMAPEQILNLRSDLGPWTDLYALGCVTWELVTGMPPFDRPDRSQVLFSHLSDPLPELKPRIAVPAELRLWLETLLAKAPDRRFACAADAAHALRALTDLPEEEPEDPGLVTLLGATARSTQPLTQGTGRRRSSPGPRATWFDDSALTEASLELDRGRTNSHDWSLPGCPLDWRRTHPTRGSRQLQGAGLGLVGLRAVPLAGRNEERDALWGTLLAVCTEGRARAVVLRGVAGTGKTRLARWLGERAMELGAARYILARHEVGDAPGEGIARAMRWELRTADRPASTRQGRLTEVLGEGLGDAVGAWLHPEDDPDRTQASSAERHALVGELLERMARQRPVILHLDDVQSSGDALVLCDYLIRRQAVAPCAVLVLLTAQEEALAEVPRQAARLEALAALDDVSTLRVAPLDEGQRVALLDGLLELEAETATRLLDRTGGNPLFAVQLVGEWAARGLLVPGRRAFRLLDPAAADAMAGVGELWLPRIERVLEGLPRDTGTWLERLALAGDALDDRDGAELSDGMKLGVDPPGMRRLVLERMCEARLGTLSEGRFSFVHGLVKEALRARARSGGRLPAHHAALGSRMLQRSSPDPVAVGRHFLLAGRARAAADLLVRGLPAHRHRFGDRAGVAASELAEDALTSAEVPVADPSWGEVRLERYRSLKGVGDGEAARELLSGLLADADTHGWPPETRLGARLEEASQAMFAGALTEAAAMLDRIEADPQRTDPILAKVHYWRTALGEFQNDLDLSKRSGLAACAVLERLGDPESRFQAAQTRCILGLMFADMSEAEPWAFEAVKRSEATGSVMSRARALHNLGKVHWYRRRLEEAEQTVARSEELYLRAGSVSLGSPRLIRILVILAQGRSAEALHLCQDLGDKRGGPGGDASLQLLELVALAGLKQWDGFDERFGTVQARLRERGWCNGEDATALEMLGRLALEQGLLDRARDVWEEALDHWERHDKREHEVDKVRGWLNALDAG